MKENKIQIIVAYLYHAFFIILGFILMQDYIDGMLTISVIAAIVYLFYWIIFNINRDRFMPWIVYLNFVIGSAIEIMLHLLGIIPEDSGWFAGLGQFFYIIGLLIYATLLGIVNLILYLKYKRADSKELSVFTYVISVAVIAVLWILLTGNVGDSMFFWVIGGIILIVICAKNAKNSNDKNTDETDRE